MTMNTRTIGLLTVVAAAVQADGGILSAAYRSDTTVSDEQFSYPWDGATAIATSVTWGITQVLIVLGLVAFARSGVAAGPSGRRGAWVAVVGASLYVPAHAITLVVYDRPFDDPMVVVVMSLFGVGTVLAAIGLLMAGAATLRSGVWSGWRRLIPISLGVWTVVMIPLQFTPLLAVTVVVYSAILIGLGIALAGHVREDSAPRAVSQELAVH